MSNSSLPCYFTLSGINYKNGFVTSCPQTPSHLVSFSQSIIPSEIINSKAFKTHRLEMMSGQWSKGCHLCKDAESIGAHSMRADYPANTEHYDYSTGAIKFTGLQHVELRFSNSCNMACKHCSTVYSSGWVSKLKNYVPDEEVVAHKLTQLLQTEHREGEDDIGMLDITVEQAEDIVKDLNANFPNLSIVEFAGGEVLYQKQFFPCLELLAQHPNAKNINISFHSNFNAKFDANKLHSLLEPFARVVIKISVDSGKNIYPYFRTGEWTTLQNNIRQFRAISLKNKHKMFLKAVCTTSIYQVMDIENIFMSLVELDFDAIGSSMVYSPPYLNPGNLSNEFKKDIIADIEVTKDKLLKLNDDRLANFSTTKNLRAWKQKSLLVPFDRFNDIFTAIDALDEIKLFLLNTTWSKKYWDAFEVYVRKTDEIWKHNFNNHMTKYKFNHDTNKIERNAKSEH